MLPKVALTKAFLFIAAVSLFYSVVSAAYTNDLEVGTPFAAVTMDIVELNRYEWILTIFIAVILLPNKYILRVLNSNLAPAQGKNSDHGEITAESKEDVNGHRSIESMVMGQINTLSTQMNLYIISIIAAVILCLSLMIFSGHFINMDYKANSILSKLETQISKSDSDLALVLRLIENISQDTSSLNNAINGAVSDDCKKEQNVAEQKLNISLRGAVCRSLLDNAENMKRNIDSIVKNMEIMNIGEYIKRADARQIQLYETYNDYIKNASDTESKNDNILNASTLIRISSLVFIIFFVQIVLSLYRDALRLKVDYVTLYMSLQLSAGNPNTIAKIAKELSPKIRMEPTPQSPIGQIISIIKERRRKEGTAAKEKPEKGQ